MRLPTLAFEHGSMQGDHVVRIAYRVLGADDVIVRWYDDMDEAERFMEVIDSKPGRYLLRVTRYEKE